MAIEHRQQVPPSLLALVQPFEGHQKSSLGHGRRHGQGLEQLGFFGSPQILDPDGFVAVADLPVVLDDASDHADSPAGNAEELALDMSDPIVAEISELIDTRIRPAATQGGGDVVLRGYDSGMVYVEFKGSAFALKGGVENMLRHYVPEVVGVADWRDALPKPGLDTPEAVAIQGLLESSINPSVASHGGHISLIDVDGPRAYIRMEGGCQGCGMADVTLKQGVQAEIQKLVPTIREVLDVTDHAGGTNPYYQSA